MLEYNMICMTLLYHKLLWDSYFIIYWTQEGV